MCKKLILAIGLLLWPVAGAHAQTFSALTVTTCGAQSLPNNQFYPVTIDLTGKICTGGTGGSPSTPSDSVIVPSSSAATGIVPGVAGSAASSLVLKASAGNLYNVYATCTAACWLMVFNATALPANGATTAGVASGNLQECIPVAAGGFGLINYNPGPSEVFSVGITAVISSTACALLTASGVGFIHGSVQ